MTGPGDLERTTGKHHLGVVIGKIQKNRGDKGCAGPCSTGQGRTRSTFPDADLQTIAGVHLKEMHVGFGWEKMVNLKSSTPCVEGNRTEVGNWNHDVGISHPNRGNLQRSIRKIDGSLARPSTSGRVVGMLEGSRKGAPISTSN